MNLWPCTQIGMGIFNNPEARDEWGSNIGLDYTELRVAGLAGRFSHLISSASRGAPARDLGK